MRNFCPRVLVVDDDKSVREVIVALLSTQFETSAAGCAEEALALVATARPTLVLCDVEMPGMDGFEFTQTLRALGFTTPVVLVSGWTDGATEQRAYDAGANGFLLKPFQVHELIGAVERYSEVADAVAA